MVANSGCMLECSSATSSSSDSNTPPGDIEVAVGTSSLYHSEIFIIVVGADKRQFSIHESVLSQSPVLQRICTGGFLESSTKHIELKDDDPEIFKKVLTYLYRGDFEPLFPFASVAVDRGTSADGGTWVHSTLWPGMSMSQRDEHSMESALVYTIAEKYQLERLKSIAVQKLKNLQPLSSPAFLALSFQVYSNVPESDTIFRDFFARYAPERLMDASEVDLRPYLREGGLLAEDIFCALRSSCIAPDFKKTAMTSTHIWRQLFSGSALARKIYQILERSRVNYENFTEHGWASHPVALAHIAATDNSYKGRTPASLAATTGESLDTIHAVGDELHRLGLLVATCGSDSNAQFWDIYSLNMADFVEARMQPH
ncbi:MAG: hypothetical protein M1830_004911 [Pleopsidium flavum]|nr:MAG: hypothetical protein M1830_004911 [Pleopsidium flavum]